jgi:hypothetical protein
MKRYIAHIIISAVALFVALGHIIFPSVRIDAITLVLLLIAVLPWLGFVFKSLELPGGIKVDTPSSKKLPRTPPKQVFSLPPGGKMKSVTRLSTNSQ